MSELLLPSFRLLAVRTGRKWRNTLDGGDDGKNDASGDLPFNTKRQTSSCIAVSEVVVFASVFVMEIKLEK